MPKERNDITLLPKLSQPTVGLFQPLLAVYELLLHVIVTVIVIFEVFGHLVLLSFAKTFFDFGARPRVFPSHSDTIVVPGPAALSLRRPEPLGRVGAEPGDGQPGGSPEGAGPQDGGGWKHEGAV